MKRQSEQARKVKREKQGKQTKPLNERRKRRIEKNILKDRRYRTLIYNRVILCLAMVLLQMTVYILLLFHFYNRGGAIVLVVAGVIAGLMVLYLINKNDKPSTKLNWIIMILTFPVLGISLYLMFGEGRPTRGMNKKITGAKRENVGVLVQKAEAKFAAEKDVRMNGVSRYLMNYANYPVYDDGSVKYYPSGEKMFEDVLADLKSAEKFILIEYFIVAGGKMWDKFREIILEKAEAGVKIKMIFDDAGSLMTLPPKYDRYMESLHPNIKCYRFNRVVPVFAMRMNNRDHRKILVIDGKTAYTGGVNIADEYINEKVRFGYWKDTGVRVTGKSVNSFVVMFFTLWNAFRRDKCDLREYMAEENMPSLSIDSVKAGTVGKNGTPIPVAYTGGGSGDSEKKNNRFFIQPYDDSPLDRESVGETVYLDIINRSSRYLYIFTPYLILDDFVRTALCNAAKRGVDVRIVTPGIPDKKAVFRLTRANYSLLLKSGVKIYEYTPGFIHAKSMLSDDECAVVGTINLDYRSLYLHFENAVCFSDCKAIEDLKTDCENTFAVSHKMTPDDIRRNVFGKLFDSVFRVFETLL